MNQGIAKRILGTALTLGALVCPAFAQAQAWPTKPIRLIVNFPAGGAADVIARAISPGLSEALGQPIVIENKGGAGGNIGADAVAKSPADGYTLLMSSGGTVSVNPHIYSRLSYDPVKDLQPVAATARILVFLETRPEVPVKNVTEFIAYAKANPGKLSYGSPGTGSSPHLAGAMLADAAKVNIVHVPYKGAAPALNDLLGGQIQFWFDPGIGLAHVRSGKLRLLAVGSLKRSPLFPDVPTLAEAGMPGFDADSWFGIYAPAGTPASVVARINREVNKLLNTKVVRDRIQGLGAEPAPMSPAEFGEAQRRDSDRFGALIRAAGIKAD